MAKLYKGTIRYNGRPGNVNIAVGHNTRSEYNTVAPSQNENVLDLAAVNQVKYQHVEFDLDEVEFNEVKSGTRAIFLWSMPAAACSIKGPDMDRYSGLARVAPSALRFITHSAAKQGYSGELRTGNVFQITKSAIDWTAEQMTSNLSHPAVNDIKNAPWGHTGNRFPQPGSKESKMGAMAHPNDSFEQSGLKGSGAARFMDLGSTIIEGYAPWTSGDWDLKPQIYASWGSRLRFGNEHWVLSYDHLSNIHYGYISAACKMNVHSAIQLAGVQVLGNREDPGDEWATVIGSNLYHNHPNGITGRQLWQEIKRYRGKSRANIYTQRGTRHSLWDIEKLDGKF